MMIFHSSMGSTGGAPKPPSLTLEIEDIRKLYGFLKWQYVPYDEPEIIEMIKKIGKFLDENNELDRRSINPA